MQRLSFFDCSTHSFRSWSKHKFSAKSFKQVSPNPISSATTIRFELNYRMVARLDVYDSTGSLAASLLNEEKEPGSYSISWDGKNTSGQQLPGGVYYIRLEANNSVQTQKVILSR